MFFAEPVYRREIRRNSCFLADPTVSLSKTSYGGTRTSTRCGIEMVTRRFVETGCSTCGPMMPVEAHTSGEGIWTRLLGEERGSRMLKCVSDFPIEPSIRPISQKSLVPYISGIFLSFSISPIQFGYRVSVDVITSNRCRLGPPARTDDPLWTVRTRPCRNVISGIRDAID